uniref:Uncharacterized protein n=1 Tax=Meloidogyne incognita TaxID=6306 RepID=A0A914KKN0_MELIC
MDSLRLTNDSFFETLIRSMYLKTIFECPPSSLSGIKLIRDWIIYNASTQLFPNCKPNTNTQKRNSEK